MRRTTAYRHDSGTAKRRGLGVLALLWFNLAVTPCAMALGAEHACMHAPPAEGASTSGHEHDHMHHDGGAPPCDVVTVECCEVAEAFVEPRSQDLELKSTADIEIAGAPPYVELHIPVAARIPTVADPPDPPLERAPRHVMFCVFLN